MRRIPVGLVRVSHSSLIRLIGYLHKHSSTFTESHANIVAAKGTCIYETLATSKAATPSSSLLTVIFVVTPLFAE